MALTAGLQYRFKVVAENVIGTAQSNVVAAYVADLPAAPAAAPVLVVGETTSDTIRLDFLPFDSSAAAQTGGSPINSYHL